MSKPTPFANTEEMVAMMRDPRYSSDPQFRDHVMARLAASSGVGPSIAGGFQDGTEVYEAGHTAKTQPGSGLASRPGGVAFRDHEAERRASGAHLEVGISSEATYDGMFHDAEDLTRAFGSEEYKRSPAFREAVMHAVASMRPRQQAPKSDLPIPLAPDAIIPARVGAVEDQGDDSLQWEK